MNKPTFITFTGADDFTSIDGMCALAQLYPIEWGILFSPKRQGQGRYPSIDFIRRVTGHSVDLQLSAHLCGGYSRSLIETGRAGVEHFLINFDRVQVNTAEPDVDPGEVRDWADELKLDPILQCRSVFPAKDALTVEWLFDASGGRGISPEAWPQPIPEALSGYAGGLRPSNVAAAVDVIGSMASSYWIDMETGVRNQHDRFDLGLCLEVCQAVYGTRGAA